MRSIIPDSAVEWFWCRVDGQLLLYTEEVGLRVRPAPVSPLYPKIRFAFTDHPITVWVGAILLRLYFEVIGLRASLVPLLVPFAKTSNNQIPPVDVRLAWWYGLALGAERFAHMTRYRVER